MTQITHLTGNDTHSAHIIADGFNAFVDGIPDNCEHDWSGDEVLFSKSGKTIYWHTYKQWAHLVTKERSRLIQEYHHEIEDEIIGGAVSCKKCKKIFSPPMY